MTSLARYFQKPTVQVDQIPLSVADNGADAIGRGIQQLGADLDVIQQRDELFWVEKTLSDLDSSASAEFTNMAENAPEGAQGFMKGFLGNLDSAYSKARQNAPSRRAGRALELGILRQRGSYENQARGFETTEKYNFRKRTIINEADNIGQEVGRYNGVPPYSPHGSLIPPGTLESSAAGAGTPEGSPSSFYESAPLSKENPMYSVKGWSSTYYAPQDFADGRSMSDKSGGVYISKSLVSKLDWVTEQFGHGKLQINSGYRSSASNLARASSGAHGPHTKGASVDIQVRDLPQAEKNRLYSLLKSQGFNAFGFGKGALHAEIREGTGKGRGGDFEWTYGSAEKYELVPVMGQGRGAVAGAGWRAINQYPYLSVAKLTARNETSTTDLVAGSETIAVDTGGTKSYGVFGLNSGGTLQRFVDNNPELGFKNKPGTPAFDLEWQTLARKNPKKLVEAQLRWHEREVVQPAQRSLVVNGLGGFSNDPRAVAFVSDMIVQYGKGGVQKHLLAGAGATSVEQFFEAVSASMRDSIDGDFKTYLAQHPDGRQGLLNRIDARAKNAMTLAAGDGVPATGNVPRWNGPIPSIENLPGYQARMDRLESMIKTMGGSPSQRAAVRETLRRQIVRGWLSSIAETNPSVAMAVLHSGKYDDVLFMEDDAAVRSVAESGWKSYETEIRDAHKALMNNLRAETQSILADDIASITATGRPTGRLTDQHRAMLTDQEKENLDLARFQNRIQKEIASATTEELPGLLDELKPEGEGFATEQKKYDYAQQLVADRMKKQANDPAGYVVSTNQTAAQAWQSAMLSNDPVKIQSAIQMIRSMQKHMGIPTSNIRSLTQSSMTHNEGLLKNAENADDAFANFVQMRTLYGGEFPSVVREMEAAGGAKGWASVNDLIDSGNVVLAKSLARVVHAGEFGPDAQIGIRLANEGLGDVARNIFDGRVKRHELKGIVPTGKSEDSDMRTDEIVGDEIGDAFDEAPTVMNAVREAAVSYYANTASLGQPLDDAKLREALQKVTGGILEHNGSDNTGKFIAPSPGMTQSQFDNMLGQIDDRDVKGAYIGYSVEPMPVTADMVRDTMQLVSAGNGKYFLRYPGAGLARTEDGLPYEFNIGEALPVLADRAKKARSYETVVDQAGNTVIVDPKTRQIYEMKDGEYVPTGERYTRGVMVRPDGSFVLHWPGGRK